MKQFLQWLCQADDPCWELCRSAVSGDFAFNALED